ncbi:hypothetical protein FAZ95_27670 [Trinickia violacea]|uniref:Polymer-forming cytoskeletal protein n=1 Tax=Trinickia violacea TaxID=2571746 RepID=A0A4P8J340_9BURK|nr:hypothetical protein [Trinickia violacea]QCP52889.1 hypothetical protein FAZ95_27670 [Trinickia violacea]
MFSFGKPHRIKKTAALALMAAGLALSGTASAQSMTGFVALQGKAYDDVKIVGVADMKQITAKSIDVTGPLTFKDVTLSGALTAQGPVSGSNVVAAGPVKVTGPFNVKRFVAKDSTDVIGGFSAEDSSFTDVAVLSNQVSLDRCKLRNLVIKKDTSAKTQTVTLLGGTKVLGDITFDSGNGEVVIAKGASVAGTVKGAKVIQN